MINAFTVDVEDYFQVSGFESAVSRNTWSRYENRVIASTHCLLDMLALRKVRGTFFILGWVADQFPDLVQEIYDRGHEIGSHSFWHRLIYRQSPSQFREDLRRSRDVLEDIVGTPIQAYRAPSFSITQQCLWALEILVEEGFRFDSSIFPVHHDRYGIPNAQRGLHRLQTAAGPIWEFPPTVVRTAGLNLPVGGGGYFRLFPLAWTTFWLAYVQRHEHQPLMFYIHPWEVDPLQPRLRVGSALAQARHYVNLAQTERKLRRLLSQFAFGPLSEVLAEHKHLAECASAN